MQDVCMEQYTVKMNNKTIHLMPVLLINKTVIRIFCKYNTECNAMGCISLYEFIKRRTSGLLAKKIIL